MHTARRHPLAPVFGLVLLCLTLVAAPLRPALAQSEEDLALLDRSAKAFSSVVKKAGPAVVHVAVEKTAKSMEQFPSELFADPFFERFFGPQFRHPRLPDRDKRNFRQQAAGSGFIIASDGYILTNNHVVEGAEKITVRLADKREFTAKVVGADPQSDVAIVKIDGRDLPVLPLGDSDALEVGEWVIAIGSPFELNQTVTVGVVSAKGRNRMGINDYENFIQTDAAINPGNSGGPLVDAQGRVIGVNTAFVAQNGGGSGIGFAVPVNMARVIAERLRADGRVVRGWLGAALKDGDLGDGPATGALVHEVDGSSPARRAGLRQGDVLVALDGAPVTSAAEVRNRIALARPGSSLQVRFLRDGAPQTATVRIGEKP